MSTLGRYLGGLREERGLSLEEVARITRVASCYLEALEREDFSALPAPVFTKGYIRAYCQVLGVPVDEALARYARSAGIVVAGREPAVTSLVGRPAATGHGTRGTLLVSFVLLLGFGVALFVVALILQSGRSEIGTRRAEPPTLVVDTRAAPAAASVPVTAATPSSAPPAPIAASPAASALSAGGVPSVPLAPVTRSGEAKPVGSTENRVGSDPTHPGGDATELPPLRLGSIGLPYRLVARATEATWLRVRTEDGRATEGTIPAGEVREWVSNRPFVLTVGNAAGVTFELNGRKLPPLGGRGVVISRLILPPPEP